MAKTSHDHLAEYRAEVSKPALAETSAADPTHACAGQVWRLSAVPKARRFAANCWLDDSCSVHRDRRHRAPPISQTRELDVRVLAQAIPKPKGGWRGVRCRTLGRYRDRREPR